MKRVLILAGIGLAILGWYAPWVTSQRQLAALTYNALDLAEFAKFINRAGIAGITREWFLVPITAAALALALWANRAPRAWQYALTVLAALLSLVPLPPYPFLLRAYQSAEDRLSLWLSVAGLMGVILLAALGRLITGRWRDVILIVLALIGIAPARELFSRALPAFSIVYASPALPAWGFFVSMIGFALMIAAGMLRET
jgi:hypothetical protein